MIKTLTNAFIIDKTCAYDHNLREFNEITGKTSTLASHFDNNMIQCDEFIHICMSIICEMIITIGYVGLYYIYALICMNIHRYLCAQMIFCV